MSKEIYSVLINKSFDRVKLGKGLWIVVINASRIPPHIGLMFNGKYSSLNIKGKEEDIDVSVLLRKIDMQSIKALFIKLIPHPVFSIDFLREHFIQELSNYERVTSETTCFKPVLSFFQENYVLRSEEVKFLYQLFPALYANDMIEKAFGIHVEADLRNDNFVFNAYTEKEIADKLNEIKRLQLSHD